MSGEIYTIRDNGEVIEMKEELYRSEDLFQRLLADHPQLLAGDQIDAEDPRRWLLVTREMPIPSEEEGSGRWALDHLFLDQDGIPTLVEVKRSTDNRLRREVVGQMLDYAANAIAYIPVEDLLALFEHTCQRRGLVSDAVLTGFLEANAGPEDFWQKVKTNLQAGKIRLLFVADVIPQELKQIVEFLNKQMDPAEVLAVQVSQYVGQGLRTLVPRLFGNTAEAQQKKSAGLVPTWTEKRFFEVLGNNRGEAEVNIAQKLLQWGLKPPRFVYWGKGKVTGAFVPQIKHNDRYFQFFQVVTIGKIYIPFGAYQTKPPFESEDKRRDLLRKLNSFLPEKLPENTLTSYPAISLSALKNDDVFRQFTQTFEWVSEQVQAS
jgi:hypothetical protein